MKKKNNFCPIASIVVLTCNRKSMVIELLKSLHQQTFIEQIEIIVVDNGSDDGTKDRVRSTFPNVVVVSLEDNIGCAGRNYGIKRARAKYVITLDDDVFLHRVDEIECIIKEFKKIGGASAINFKILFPNNKQLIPFNWFHPKDPNIYKNQIFQTDYISEGAVAFKREIFDKVGYYSDAFFISHEGPDLALRIINNGGQIFYSGNIEVLHRCSVQQRTTWRNTYYDTRNYFWLLYRHLPFSSFVVQSLVRLITTFLFSASRGQIIWYFRAVVDSFRGLPGQYKYRNVLSRDALLRLKKIRQDRPMFMDRLKNFFTKIRAQNKQY